MYVIQTEFTNLTRANGSYPDTSKLLANIKENARKYFDFKCYTKDILYKFYIRIYDVLLLFNTNEINISVSINETFVYNASPIFSRS